MGLGLPRLTWGERFRLLWGKGRRLALWAFRPRYVRASIERRVGECIRCGACCRLPFRCQLLRDNGTATECILHKHRPPNCRLFPIDEKDLADRNVISPYRSCGFQFNGKARKGE